MKTIKDKCFTILVKRYLGHLVFKATSVQIIMKL
jgi:hypothetical protein